MFAVGRISSYITAPFHPFGGAVDIIVVQQEDGSFKSSPWYVRFGKFQGVLKAREKVVNIHVNGVEAEFHMHLDHKGEAYFLKDCKSHEEGDFFGGSPPLYRDEILDETVKGAMFRKSQSCNYDGDLSNSSVSLDNRNNEIIATTTSRRPGILGLMFGRKSMKENDRGGNVEMVNARDHAELATDLLDTNWSTNLQSSNHRGDNLTVDTDVDASNDVKEKVSSYKESTKTSTPSKEHLEEVAVHSSSIVITNHAGEDSNCCLSADETRSEFVGHQENSSGNSLETNRVKEVHFEENITQTSSSGMHEEVLEAEIQEGNCKGEGEGTSVSIAEIFESSYNNTDVSMEKLETLNVPPAGGGSLQYCSETEVKRNEHVPEGTSRSKANDAADEESCVGCHNQESESCSVVSASKNSRDSDGISLEKVTQIDFGKNGSQMSEESSPKSNCHVPLSDEQDQQLKRFANGVQLEKSTLPDRLRNNQVKSKYSRDKQLQFSDTESSSVTVNNHEAPSSSERVDTDGTEEDESDDVDHEECYESVSELSGAQTAQTSPLAVPRSNTHLGNSTPFDGLPGSDTLTKSLPNIRSRINDLERSNHFHRLSRSLDFNSENCDRNLPKKEPSSSSELYTGSEGNRTYDSFTSESSATVVDFENNHGDKVRQVQVAVGPIAPASGSWRLWPFSLNKSKGLSTMQTASDNVAVKKPDAVSLRSKSLSDTYGIERTNFSKRQVQSLTPCSEQLASLNLNEGRNVVTFNFSTSMLGKQQVDARIYLWKWNTRIVISDVDGTITKSDVLGQFMPLVGKDWSQTGVVHLFSAIKENGYQFLFLSARSISQASLTRQFLFNLTQDGKALPDGPVVISPDGLFPSLYREVIRRAPHEFKISCLEDIRALFPPDSNPFYAGFGNRDTDEFSYLRVGIPKGKIFIINPKGEVALNRGVDTRSYTSLHSLVNGMFPPISTIEQEDYNSWNYWKMPLPDINM